MARKKMTTSRKSVVIIFVIIVVKFTGDLLSFFLASCSSQIADMMYFYATCF